MGLWVNPAVTLEYFSGPLVRNSLSCPHGQGLQVVWSSVRKPAKMLSPGFVAQLDPPKLKLGQDCEESVRKSRWEYEGNLEAKRSYTSDPQRQGGTYRHLPWLMSHIVKGELASSLGMGQVEDLFWPIKRWASNYADYCQTITFGYEGVEQNVLIQVYLTGVQITLQKKDRERGGSKYNKFMCRHMK